MTSTLQNPSEVSNPAPSLEDAPDANVENGLPKASQLVLQALRGVEEMAENGADDFSDASRQPPDAIVLPTAAELVQQVSRRETDTGEDCNPPDEDASLQHPEAGALAPPRLPNRKRRRRGYLLTAALAAAAVIIATGAADTSIPRAAGRQFGLMAVPADQAPRRAGSIASEANAAGSDESAAPPSDLLNQAALLHPTAVAFSTPTPLNATDGAEEASIAPVADSASPASTSATTASATPADDGVRGITDKQILFGIAAPFSGASRELGRQMKMGLDAAFDQLNDAGGVNGRQLRLVAADDGYEPARTADAMHELYEKDRVFGFIGNVGTPTAAVALPFALEHHALFFGAFSGANLLRRDPPDRYVFNFRASYAEETDAVMRYLLKVRRLQPREIVVFAQRDSFGDSGYDGVSKAVRALPGDNPPIVRLGYKRNTVDVQDAVTQLAAFKGRIKAVVMVASYRAAAKFIEKTRDLYPAMIYTNVSFVGSTALADELMLLGPKYANGVVVTQVVPAVNSYASIILKYKSALAKYFPGEAVDYVSLEGYIDGMILAEAVRRAGPQINTEKLVDELERMHDFDMGLGTLVTFNADEHQGSHKVWGAELDDTGHYQPIDLQ